MIRKLDNVNDKEHFIYDIVYMIKNNGNVNDSII